MVHAGDESRAIIPNARYQRAMHRGGREITPYVAAQGEAGDCSPDLFPFGETLARPISDTDIVVLRRLGDLLERESELSIHRARARGKRAKLPKECRLFDACCGSSMFLYLLSNASARHSPHSMQQLVVPLSNRVHDSGRAIGAINLLSFAREVGGTRFERQTQRARARAAFMPRIEHGY